MNALVCVPLKWWRYLPALYTNFGGGEQKFRFQEFVLLFPAIRIPRAK